MNLAIILYSEVYMVHLVTFLMQINSLSQVVHGITILPQYQAPAAYTKEAFGVEYLYAQSGYMFNPKDEELEEKTDKGFCEEGAGSGEQVTTTAHSEDMATVAPPSEVSKFCT